jgi:hypothetical protein
MKTDDGTVRNIIRHTCRLLNVPLEDFFGRERTRKVLLARGVAVAAARRATPVSFPGIARAMGSRSHSTTVTQYKVISERLDKTVGEMCGVYGHDLSVDLTRMIVDDFVTMVLVAVKREAAASPALAVESA